MLRKWHRDLVPAGGNFRTTDVYVGSRDSWRPCFQLEERLAVVVDELERSIHAAGGRESLIITAAGRFFYDFEMIHPFADANGRVGQLCLFFTLRQVMQLPTFLWTSVDGNSLDREGLNACLEGPDASVLIAAIQAGIEYGRHRGLDKMPLRLNDEETAMYNRMLQYGHAYAKAIRIFDVLDPYLCLRRSQLWSFNQAILGGFRSNGLIHGDSLLSGLNIVMDTHALSVSTFVTAISEAFVSGRAQPLFEEANVDTLLLMLDFLVRRVVPTDASITTHVSLEDFLTENTIRDILLEFVAHAWRLWKQNWSPEKPVAAAGAQFKLDFDGLEAPPFSCIYLSGERACTIDLRYFSVDSISFDGNAWCPFYCVRCD
ncbi:hypothetical protein SELMODRAFT_415776 [Selaginella moellendorffii]|uniref:Fido domain-containing protein n=2 Tax=Selaginella moellendorffii TaxID=88036 RepID=D8RX75_SELML|nr:hypothetical protein SELMODRAFT_415776 [Selaginella moellendorffii]